MSTNQIQTDDDGKPAVLEPGANGSGSPTVEGTASVFPWTIGLDQSALEQESDYYRAHLPEWHEQEGQHVLIHGQEHFGFFPTRNAALEEGFRRFGRVPFFVKQIQRDEKPQPMMWVIL
jgi:hypothetical protein